MKVYVITKRTSIEYEGTQEEVISVYSNAELAIKEKNYLNRTEGETGFKDVEFEVNSYNVIEE